LLQHHRFRDAAYKCDLYRFDHKYKMILF